MAKRNYAAWHIDPKAFSKDWEDLQKLMFFARYAILAPSGHNTQPWLLHPQTDSVLVSIHPDHHLSIDGSGLLSVEPYISLGSFFEVFRLAAQGFGYDVIIKLFPGSGVAELRLGQAVQPQPELLDAIVARVSNRNPFAPDPIAQDTLQVITGQKLRLIKLTTITDRADVEFLAEQTAKGITGIMSKPLYREELSHWVRANHTRKFDGMPGFTHGFGTVPALVSKAAIKHAPAGGPQAEKSAKLIRNSGALVIVRCTEDSKEAFIEAGRMFASICVRAQAEGFATSALGAAVLDPVTRETVTQRFNITDRPVYLLRIGKALTASRHSPRWPLEKIVSPANA